MDIGGSNTILGKPVEDYIINVQSLPEYKEILQTVFDRLDYVLPSLSRTLRAALHTQRTWYLVPIELKKLPNTVIGIPSDTLTGQYALHTKKSIWISDLERSKTEDLQSAATHILHEIVMSLRVDQNLKSTGSKLFLYQEDYEDIRALTRYLLSPNLSSDDLQNFLLKHRFYYEGSDNNSYPLPYQESFLTTTQQVYTYLKQQDSKNLPYIYQDQNTQKFKGYCVFEFDQTHPLIKIHIYDQTYKNLIKTEKFYLSEIVSRKESPHYLHLNLLDQTESDNRQTKAAHFAFNQNQLTTLAIIKKDKKLFESHTTTVCSKNWN
jgi:hypothetical protein